MNRRSFIGLAGAAVVGSQLPACGSTEKELAADAPRSSFDKNSTADEVLEGIDLSGKLALVTGCTSGIGFETMRALASHGAHVVGTSRSLQKAATACHEIAGNATPLQLELSDFESVNGCADAFRAMDAPLDILICNAGFLGGKGKPELIDGVEKHFVINHLGHFLLVNRLLNPLLESEQGRIVMLSSRAAYTSAPGVGIEFDNLDAHRDYGDRRAYGHSKLANALVALQLSKNLKNTSVTANAVHPGVINTEIDRNMNRFIQGGFAVATALGFGKSIEQGAATTCHVAASPALSKTSGKFFEDCNAVTIVNKGHVHDAEMAAKLWQVSEEMTGDYLLTDNSV
ncbi:MAG: SDR family NAD(P)-dependent oxidoreductase [Woeseiaceae bacterium]